MYSRETQALVRPYCGKVSDELSLSVHVTYLKIIINRQLL